jgi:hypothetical protein
MSEATIASFVLRFTQEHVSSAKSPSSAWRGVIRHIQTEEEVRFVQMEDALAFISRYVDITPKRIIEDERGEPCD